MAEEPAGRSAPAPARDASSVRILQTSDWQLGMTRHFLGAQAQADYTSARIEAIRTMAALADAEGCACCVVAGDVWESNHLDRQTVARSLEALEAFSVPVLLLPGNHDPLGAASIYRSPAFLEHRPPHVEVLDSSVPRHPVDGLQVVGAPWASRRPAGDLVAQAVKESLAAAGPPPPGTVRVVVGHGQVREGHPDPGDPALVSLRHLEEAIDAGDVHYVALGDRHSVTSHGPTGRVWHSGTPVQTDFDEVDPNKALVVELGRDGSVGVTAHQVGTWRFVHHEAELCAAADVDALGRWLEGVPAKHETVVKLRLVGTLGLQAMAALDELVAYYGSVFAAVERWERGSDLVAYADESELTSLELSGFARRAVERLDAAARAGRGGGTGAASGGALPSGAPAHTAADSIDPGTAADALRLLYRLAQAS